MLGTSHQVPHHAPLTHGGHVLGTFGLFPPSAAPPQGGGNPKEIFAVCPVVDDHQSQRVAARHRVRLWPYGKGLSLFPKAYERQAAAFPTSMLFYSTSTRGFRVARFYVDRQGVDAPVFARKPSSS